MAASKQSRMKKKKEREREKGKRYVDGLWRLLGLHWLVVSFNFLFLLIVFDWIQQKKKKKNSSPGKMELGGDRRGVGEFTSRFDNADHQIRRRSLLWNFNTHGWTQIISDLDLIEELRLGCLVKTLSQLSGWRWRRRLREVADGRRWRFGVRDDDLYKTQCLMGAAGKRGKVV